MLAPHCNLVVNSTTLETNINLTMAQKIILASSSPYRKLLLEKLHINFTSFSPNIDESPLPNENPRDLVLRLARAKAQKATKKYKSALIIASDQVATLENKIIGKPKDKNDAKAMLSTFSGKNVIHYTSLVVFDPHSQKMVTKIEPFEVEFKKLSDSLIDHYLETEQPFDCAGAVKSEGLGVALFNRLHGRDPNALVGLPLMALLDCFQEIGVSWY